MLTTANRIVFILISVLLIRAGADAQSVAKPNRVTGCTPAPEFGYTQNACNPRTIQFHNLTTGALVLNWEFGNGNTGAGTNPTVTYSQFGTYAVKLRIRGISGCTDSITKLVSVTAQADSLIITRDTTICRGSSVQLNATASLNYCWGPAPGLNNTAVLNPVATPAASTTYYFTSQSTGPNLVTNGDFSAGNTGFGSDYTSQFPNTTQATYWVDNDPKAWNINFDACVEHTTGTGKMMMVNGSQTTGTRVWTQTITVTPNTNYAFTAWIQSLAALNPARLKFTINEYTLTPNLNAGFVACQWSRFYATWNSGANNTATISIINNNTIANGNDFALDDISFSPLIVKQDSINITVIDPPDITVTPNTSICPGESVQLNASGAGNISWSPATGLSNPNISNPVATPQVTTRYVASGYNTPGCVGKDSLTVIIKPTPVITQIADTGFCTGGPPVTLFADAPGAAQYVWTPAAGLSNSNISNPAASPAATTRYYVEITGINGCKSRDSVNVAVLPVPVVNTRPDTTICEASNLELRTTSSGATSFSWSPATGLSDPTMANPVATPLVPTRYVVTASNGSCTARDSVMLNLVAAPVVTKSGDTTICHQGQAQLFASGGVGYSWMPATGLSSTSVPNPVASPPAPTRYYVTVTGSNGCSRKDSINIGWVAKPVFTVNPSATSSCIGDTVLLTAAGADNYHWYSGTNILSRYTAATMVVSGASQQYSVAVQHVFCRLRDTLRAAITVNSLPYVELAKSNDIDCSNASASLTATGGVSYSWYPASAVPGGSGPTAVVTPAASTTYRVVATDANGCRGSDSVRVVVNMDPSTAGYYMANAFTPNNDGKNDCFGIKYWGVVEQLEFSVYNRWGERIFHSRNVSSCWDGSYRGVPQPAGTYVFQVKAVTACGEVFKRGSLVLMR